MELPDPPYDKISLTYEEHTSAQNEVSFQAIDANGKVVDEALPENDNGPVESVALASKNNIVKIRMAHTSYSKGSGGDYSCSRTCAEPHIGEVRACKT